MTLNDTHKYTWVGFREQAIAAVQNLFTAHPKPDQLKVQSLSLRYFDAVELDYATEDVFAFLKNKLKVTVSLPEQLFQETGVSSRPIRFAWETTFQTNAPRGEMTVRFVTGQHHGKPALIWETRMHSDESLPELPTDFGEWIDGAHRISEDWFFKLITGDLEKRFSGD
jgi:uncharacterized protein (TIGR04255 family)